VGMKEYIIKVDDERQDIMGGMPLMDDPIELVRCKGCVDWKRRECGTYGYCERHDGFFDQNWFCADGESKEGR